VVGKAVGDVDVVGYEASKQFATSVGAHIATRVRASDICATVRMISTGERRRL
jgi:hypothetical protein